MAESQQPIGTEHPDTEEPTAPPRPEPVELPDGGYVHVRDAEGLAECIAVLEGYNVLGVATESDSFFSYQENGKIFDPNSCMKVKGANKLDDDQRRVLGAVVSLRDPIAKHKNRPSFKVWGNDIGMKLPQTKPTTRGELTKALGEKAHVLRRYGRDVLGAVQAGAADTEAPPQPPKPVQRWSPGLPPMLLTVLLLLTACAAENPAPKEQGGPTNTPSQQPPSEGGPRYSGLTVSSSDLEAIREACAKPLAPPTGDGYQGPIVDTHVHTSLENAQGPFALALLEEMNRHGVSRVVIQADHSPEITKHPGLLSVSREVEATWGEIATVCPRILPLIYAFDPSDDTSWDYVEKRLATGKYAGVGEIEFVHSKLKIKKPVHTATMDRIYERLSTTGGIFHIQADTQGDPALTTEIEELIRSHPKIRFIWFSGQHCFAMDDVSNLLCTLFPNEGMSNIESFPAVGQPRIVLGTDHSPAGFHSASAGHLPYGSFGEGVTSARRLLMNIDPTHRDGVAHGHFNQLVPEEASVAGSK